MSEKAKSLFLQIAGLKIKVKTNYFRYYNYLSLYFKKIILPERREANFDIEIDVYWLKKNLKYHIAEIKKTDKFFEIGTNTFIARHRGVTIRKVGKRKKMIFDFTVKDKKFCLKVVIQRKILKDVMRYGLLGKSETEIFFAFTYPILYYPVFWYLEYFLSRHILHASAIEFDNKSIVVCGLEGIGKTSLALLFLEKQESCLLSDNLVFYDKKKIYPCYELIRIHKNEKSFLWYGKFEKVDKLKALTDFYSPKVELKREGTRPDIFIFPEFGSDFFIEERPRKEATNRAIVLSYLPAELNNYFEYRNLYNLLDMKFNAWESQYKVLNDLLHSVCSYRVVMPRSDGLQKNFKRIRDFIKGIR